MRARDVDEEHFLFRGREKDDMIFLLSREWLESTLRRERSVEI